MTSENPLSETEPSAAPLVRSEGALTASQWATLIGMGIALVGIVITLIWVLWNAGRPPATSLESLADLPGAVAIQATTTPVLPIYVPDAVPTPAGLYWPADPQPLATPNAPSDLLWWDAQFSYRQPVLLDSVAAEMPAGTWARVLFEGQTEQREGKMRADGDDLRVVVWDGAHWWEIGRRIRPFEVVAGWEIMFHIQDREIARRGGYYLYFGNLSAELPPVARDAPETSRLLLELGEKEGVEWGPTISWRANNTTPQTLVSPDGRIVIECPPGGLTQDIHVRMRTVPLQERNRNRPLPEYELHADPPPGPPGPSNIARWSPPLRVTINWAGLPVNVRDLRDRAHFEYDHTRGVWYGIPVEFDERTGIMRVTTEQP